MPPIAILLAVAILVQAAGNVCLTIGMKGLAALAQAHPGDWLPLIPAALGSPVIIIGVVMLIGFFILFATVLSRSDLSLAMPIVSFEIVVNVALAYVIIGEPVSPLRWAGTALVATGVALVALSGARKRTAPGGAAARLP